MSVDATRLQREALLSAPLSLQDDPTAYSAFGDAPALNDVRLLLQRTAGENARSAVAAAIGKESERIATDMNVAIDEDGPLADLEGIWATEIVGIPCPPLALVIGAVDWDERVTAVRQTMADAINRHVTDPVDVETQLAELLLTDPRLEGLADADLATAAQEDVVWDDPPAVEETAFDPWDDPSIGDEPAPAPAEPVKPTTLPTRGRAKAAKAPRLVQIMVEAGFQDKELAELLGIDKAYFSLIRNGKRPWQGLTDEKIERFRRELLGRQRAVGAALTALSNPEAIQAAGGAA